VGSGAKDWEIGAREEGTAYEDAGWKPGGFRGVRRWRTTIACITCKKPCDPIVMKECGHYCENVLAEMEESELACGAGPGACSMGQNLGGVGRLDRRRRGEWEDVSSER